MCQSCQESFPAFTLCILSTSASSEDPDEILHNEAFHQGLHYLLRYSQSLEKDIQLSDPIRRSH